MQNCLENYYKKELIKPVKKLDQIFTETLELVAIIAKGIETAQRSKTK